MAYSRFISSKFLLFLPLLFVLVIAVACGDDATPVVIEKEVIVEKEVIKEVPVEVVKEVIVIATPTPTPEAMMKAAKTERLVVAFGALQREVNVPWYEAYIALDRRHLYEFLIGIDRKTGLLEPHLATSWESNPEGTDWTFNLREDVQFHFGWGEFTGEDVKFRVAQSVSEGSMAYGGRTYRKVLDSVEVVNDHKVVFHFSQPDPVSVLLFETGKLSAAAAISKAQWDKEGLDGYQERPTGTGSYRWVKRVAGSHTVSERVENHWRHTPDFKELVVQLTKEESTRMAALLAGETHIVLLSRDVQSQALDAGMKLAQTAFPSRISWLTLGGSYFLTPEKLDFEKSPWSNPDKGILLREAMNRAINREELLDTLFLGQGEQSKLTGFHSSMEGWNPEWDETWEDKYGYDPERAKELLAEAGYADGYKVQIYVVHRDDMPEAQVLVETVGNYWSEIGLDVSLLEVEYPTVQKRTSQKELQGSVRIHTSLYRPPQFSMMGNWGGACGGCLYDSQFVIDKFEILQKTVDLKDRARLTQEVGDHMFALYPNIPLFWLRISFMYNPKVVAEYLTPGNLLPAQSHLEYVSAVK